VKGWRDILAKDILSRDILARKVTAKELAIMCRQTATMLQAGIPILQCLEVLLRQCENKTLAAALKRIAEDLARGASLGEAMSYHPKVFRAVFVNMVKSGEMSGTLEMVFNRLGADLQKESQLTAKIKSAMVYPAAVVLVALVSVLILLVFVIPQFVIILNSMTVPLPVTTRMLIGASEILREQWYWVLLGMVALILTSVRLLKREESKRIKDRLIIRAPLVGQLLHKLILARFCRSLSALLQAGVPILTALRVVGSIAGNTVITESIGEAEESIRRGDSLALPLQESGVFPPLVVKMVAVGEETGAIDRLLDQIAGFYEAEVEEQATRLAALIEPVLIVVVGGIVAFVILSIMLPVFGIMNHLE